MVTLTDEYIGAEEAYVGSLNSFFSHFKYFAPDLRWVILYLYQYPGESIPEDIAISLFAHLEGMGDAATNLWYNGQIDRYYQALRDTTEGKMTDMEIFLAWIRVALTPTITPP